MRHATGEAIRQAVKQVLKQANPALDGEFASLLPTDRREHYKRIFALYEKRLEESMKLGIMGEFRSGKSSIVNALAKHTVALTDEVEATATLNRYYYSDNEHAVITYNDNASAQHMSIEAALQLLSERRYDTEWLHRIQRLDIGYPIPLLKDIELWDTPGLGGSDFNSNLAQYFAQQVDAVLWVFDVNTIGRSDISATLANLDFSDKMVIGIVNKSEHLSPQEFKRAANLIRELYPYVRFADIIPFSALLALYHCGIITEQPVAFGDAVPTDGGLSHLLEIIKEKILYDPQRLATRSILSDCIAVFTELSDVIHLRYLFYQRQLTLFREAFEVTSRKIQEGIGEYTEQVRADIRRHLHHYLQSRLLDEFHSTSLNPRDTASLNEAMNRVFDTPRMQDEIESFLKARNSVLLSTVQQLGIGTNETIQNLLSSAERIEIRRVSHIFAPADATTNSSSSSHDESIFVGAGAGFASVFLFHPPAWVVPIVVAIASVIWSSIKEGDKLEKVRQQRWREAEKVIDKLLDDQVMPQVVSKLNTAMSQFETELRTQLEQLLSQRFLGGESVEKVKETCDKLLHAYSEIAKWLEQLERVSGFDHDGSTTSAVPQTQSVASGEKVAARRIMTTILDEARRYLWVIDPNLSPEVLKWLSQSYPNVPIRILTVESNLHENLALVIESELRQLRQSREGSVNIGMLRDGMSHTPKNRPPFSGAWVITERSVYYFSEPISVVMGAQKAFSVERVNSDSDMQRRITREQFQRWWFGEEKSLPMLPIFLET
jgi:GTPase SAR1 family protein